MSANAKGYYPIPGDNYGGRSSDDVVVNDSGDLPPEKRAKSCRGAYYTIEEAMDAVGWGKFQVWLTVICGLGFMAEEMEVVVLTVLSPALQCYWDVTSTQQALVSTFVFVGMTVGAPLWGLICDRYGRKTGLQMTYVVTLYFSILSAFSPSMLWLYLLRGAVGAAFSGVSHTSTLLIEYTTTRTRAYNAIFLHLFASAGGVATIAIAVLLMPTLGWRWLLMCCALLCVLPTFLTFAFLPESIRFQMTRGRTKDAQKTLEMISRHNERPLPEGRLYVPLNEVDSTERGQFTDLFKPELRRTTFTVWSIWFTTSLLHFGTSLLTSELMKTQSGCPESENSESLSCSLECRGLYPEDYQKLFVISLGSLVAIPTSMLLVKLLSRRVTFLAMFSTLAVFSGLLATCISKAAVTGFSFVIRMFTNSAFHIAYLYTLEAYPTTVRAFGLGCGSSVARVGGIITPFIAQVLLQKSVYATVGVYAMAALLTGVISLSLPIETKGSVIEDFTSQTDNE